MLIPLSFARRALPLALFLTLLPILAGCGTKAENAHKVQETLDECLRHAEVDPDDKQARQWADRAVGVDPSASVTYLGERKPGPTGPGLSLAAIFETAGDDAALADYMAQAVQKFPDDERGYLFLMDAQDRLGRTADRKGTASKLAALLTQKLQRPGAQDIPVLTDRLAQAYWDAGDAVNGELEYKKALTAYPSLSSYPEDEFPGDFGPYNGLAYADAVANTHLPEALALATKALALARSANRSDGEIAAIQDTLAWVQYRMGDDKDAEQNLQEASDTDPREAELRYHLGAVYAAEGKTDAARAEFGHALLLAPGYADAQVALAKLPKAATS